MTCGVFKMGEQLCAVFADGLNRATFLGLRATRLFIRILRLLVNEGVTAVLVTLEIIRSGLPAEIAVNALVVYKVGAANVFGVSVFFVSHKSVEVRGNNLSRGGYVGKPHLCELRE